MMDSIAKLQYREKAGILEAKKTLDRRLTDRLRLSLPGIHGESLWLTGMAELRKKCADLQQLYDRLPQKRGVQASILLDAYSSATIEGARTTVEQVREAFSDPKTKDDRMVVNAIRASNYAYGRPITEKNIRRLWEKVVASVCENQEKQGRLYREGMVYIGSAQRIIHTPAEPEALPYLMAQLFAFLEARPTELLLVSFIAHFYFVYVHPFCDGNGRTARILNASQLYHSGWVKIRSLSLASAINQQLGGYYGSLSDSEAVLPGAEGPWLDLSPFVSYMLDALERCMIDGALSKNVPTPRESELLERMNRKGRNAEITASKAAKILKCSDGFARRVLNSLTDKGYLTAEKSQVPHIYRLEKHFPQ